MSTEPGGADNPFTVSSSPPRPAQPTRRAAQRSATSSLVERTTPSVRGLRKIKIFDSPPPPALRINRGPPSTIPRSLAGSSQSAVSSSSTAVPAQQPPAPLTRDQRVRRRREEAEATRNARQALTTASTNVLPRRRSTVRIRPDLTGTPSDPNGYRAPRGMPLTRQDLLINGVAPTPMETNRTHQRCGICLHVKSHPVSYLCGHSHCYCCIRLWLEQRWVCPTCITTMTQEPHRNYEEEAGLAFDFPDRVDNSVVDYTWDGLKFPRRRIVYAPDSD